MATLAPLAQSWFEPQAQPQTAARAAIVIIPAMGVRQDFYTGFAEFLAAHGFLVATFDYRGVGFNAPKQLRGVALTFQDWYDDIDSVIAEARRRAPNAPLFVCGHSLGGQVIGQLAQRHHITGALTIASGTGYWRHNPRMTLSLFYLWFVAMPLYSRVFGYFPGQRFNKVGNLPREIALTWSRWCRQPEYLLGDGNPADRRGYEELTIPMLSLSFSDDDYIPKPAIEQLHGFYRNARVERHHVDPASVGEKRIGHFGFFKLGGKRAESNHPSPHPLWQQCALWFSTHSELTQQ